VPDSLLEVTTESYAILSDKCLIDNPPACGKAFSYLYWVMFLFVMTDVMVNLLVAVILEAFSEPGGISE
jgi:hypothetical protein